MIKLDYLPDGYDDIVEYYGNPEKGGNLDYEWYKNNTTAIKLPFYLRQSWGGHEKIYRLRVHVKIAEALKDTLMDVAHFYGKKFHADGFDVTGGTYNFRLKKGKNERSTHSWGIAIDMLPSIGCFGCDPENFPKEMVRIFKEHGFTWGGDWDHPDGQHFQACRGY